MRRILLTFLALLVSAAVFCQNKYTINGYIKDSSNGEALIGATVYVKEISNGVTTNVYGFYSITLEPGTYTVQFSYVGYSTQLQTVSLQQNLQLNVDLEIESETLEEIVIEGELEQANVENTEMSTNKLDIRTILKVPTLLGEADVFRSILLLPGVTTVGEGASGFNVRGGSVGQNLVLLDEAPVYNSSHLFGFFSVFNPDAVKDTKLYKGAIPSRYGGRLSSILDVRMKEGNSKKFEGNGGIGSIFSRLAVEAPIVKDKSSFIVAGRRSYLDILARPFVPLLEDGGKLYFYDLTLKTNYTFNRKNKLYASGYFGRDVFFFDKQQGFSWGNTTGTVRWNHLYNERLFSNVTFVYSNYDYQLQFGDDDLDKFNWNSSISNFILKPQFTYFIDSNNELDFGGEAIYYSFTPANAVGVSNGNAIDVSLDEKYNLEAAVYVGNRQKINHWLSLEYGLRYSHFQLFGPGNVYRYNDTIPGFRRYPISAENVGKGESIVDYGNFEPRASFRVQLSPKSSLKGSYNRMVQYLHLISNTAASNPLDVWTPSSREIKPELADQFTLGYFRDLGPGKEYELSLETYYRTAQNQVDYIDGADILINEFLEGDLLSGKGRAYGLEAYLQKKTGKLTGWLSYTLARTESKVNGINNHDWYPTRYDQTHNLKIAGFYDVSERVSLSSNFVFVTGSPSTFPTSRYVMQDLLIPYNANNSRNNVRLPTYHRLDVSCTLQGKKTRKGRNRKIEDNWVFSIYNLYARKNPFSIYFSQRDQRVVDNNPIDSKAVQFSIIGSLIPAVSYNFKF